MYDSSIYIENGKTAMLLEATPHYNGARSAVTNVRQ